MERDLERYPILENAIPEFDSVEGIRELEKRISKLLETQDTVVVAFNAAGINVGKTYLSAKLQGDLRTKGIAVLVAADATAIIGRAEMLASDKEDFQTNKGVLILEAQAMHLAVPAALISGHRARLDEEIRGKDIAGIQLDHVDIVVGIRRPDVKFYTGTDEKNFIIADLIINNEGARNK